MRRHPAQSQNFLEKGGFVWRADVKHAPAGALDDKETVTSPDETIAS